MFNLTDKLQTLAGNYHALEEQLGRSELLSRQDDYRNLVRRHAELQPIMQKYALLRKAYQSHQDAQALLDDTDAAVSQLAQEELRQAGLDIETLEQEIKLLLVPPDPNDEKNILIEIRAGTGGDEAGLFAADLLRMYTRYAELRGWKADLLDSHETTLGGFKEVTLGISGERIYSEMKYESGTHRVQRIPQTETQGRIHTSAVTVAVLPEAEEVEVQVKPEELRIDLYCSTGPGGQSVNTTYSAVRITHLPTNTVVAIQDEKSQHKNREKAMKILLARLYEKEQAKQNAEIAATRKALIGSGDRSQRIRTYNFPQNRVTDHRIGLTLYKLELIMNGDLAELQSALILHDRMDRLSSLETS